MLTLKANSRQTLCNVPIADCCLTLVPSDAPKAAVIARAAEHRLEIFLTMLAGNLPFVALPGQPCPMPITLIKGPEFCGACLADTQNFREFHLQIITNAGLCFR